MGFLSESEPNEIMLDAYKRGGEIVSEILKGNANKNISVLSMRVALTSVLAAEGYTPQVIRWVVRKILYETS